MIELRAVDIIQPDILDLGPSMDVAGMDQEAGLPGTLHCENLSRVTLLRCILLRAVPNAGRNREFSGLTITSDPT